MSHLPMQGVRVVEVAQYTFTPSAGAVLADWGADVIKVEHAVNGDAQRGIRFGGGSAAEGSFHPLMEHSNRGKRSIGLALELPEAREVLDRLVREADVFLTNFMPDARRRMRFDVDDIRAVNPSIIYARGSAHGQRGPDADKGGYDRSSFWARGGSAIGCTPPDAPGVIDMPAGAYGDSMGGLAIAGGIAAALFARAQTGEPSVVDVSLLGMGTWATALSIDSTLLTGTTRKAPPLESAGSLPGNPVMGYFKTSDARWIVLSMMQPGRYWADLCQHLGMDHLIDDPRFVDGLALIKNSAQAGAFVAAAIEAQPYAHWFERFQTLKGQWAPVQNELELAHDPQVRANGYIQPIVDADGKTRELVTNPVQFDERPPVLQRAPQFAEHTDDILRERGFDEEQILELKIAGACT